MSFLSSTLPALLKATQLEKMPESQMVVRFSDCDPYNHLNNARYIDYLINAREDHLMAAYGMTIYDYVKESGMGWVVGQNQISYLRPALLMEKVTIQSQLVAVGDKHLHVELRMFDENKTHLKAVMWSSFVHFDLRKQAVVPHSPEILSFMKKVVAPIDSQNFDERVAVLRGQYRK